MLYCLAMAEMVVLVVVVALVAVCVAFLMVER
jgi:hypothetical protein